MFCLIKSNRRPPKAVSSSTNIRSSMLLCMASPATAVLNSMNSMPRGRMAFLLSANSAKLTLVTTRSVVKNFGSVVRRPR